MKNIFKWRNYLGFYLLIVLLVNLVLLKLPLTNVFGYEFSVINSLLIVLLSGIYTIHFFEINFSKKNKNFIPELFKSLPLLLIIPFSVSVINSVIYGFCSFTDGLLFYIVITCPSIIIGISLGLISVLIANRFRVVLLFVLCFGILMIIAYEIYFNPQVYVFNPFIGFFPGTIYDEGISVSGKLILYRFFNLLFFGWIISAIVRLKRNKKKRLIFFSFKVLFIAIAFYLLSPKLGFSTTFGSLTNTLSNSVITEHFVIHFDKRIDTEKVKMLALNHEYYYQELEKYFEVRLDDKIQSFIFYDNNQKKELFGSRNADVAKPWLNQIYISIRNWEHTLKHELAHCFSAKFGSGILKLASGLNPMLIEGIAEAADGNYDNNSLHFMAALAYNSGYEVDIKYLLSKFGFYSKASSISYIFAGSFIQYLIDNYGISKFKEYYLTGEFPKSYRLNLNNTLKNYYSFLTNTDYFYNEHIAHYYFGRKSLFQKICPRAISEQLNDGWEQLSDYDFIGAQFSFTSVLSKTDNYTALMGLIRTYEKQDSLFEAVKLLKNKIEFYESTSYYYNLELTLADLFVKLNNFESADSLYKVLIKQQPNRKLNYIANTRRELIKKELIKKYLKGSNYDKYYILQKLKGKSYNYSSIPVMIYLSKLLDEDYDVFIEKLDKKFNVNNYSSSYAGFLLSKYMLANNDFVNARKMAGLSLRYDSDINFNIILQEQFSKTRWFLSNGDQLLNKIKIFKK
ncbi:MAG: hypothetical protein IH784_02205 [Bacteroidetes bacterium]|nr:hypothetical protein [Bacteroidota bacterium]